MTVVINGIQHNGARVLINIETVGLLNIESFNFLINYKFS